MEIEICIIISKNLLRSEPSGQKLFRVPIDTASGFEAGEVEVVTDALLRRFETGTYDVGSDGREIIINQPHERPGPARRSA